MKTTFLLPLVLLIASGCTTYGSIENAPITKTGVTQPSTHYSILGRQPTGDSVVILAFSGGGTRAAALSYGVLKALRDTKVESGNATIRLLDEVDIISSVSGGSFTSAYYGLYGDRIFRDFEEDFLRQDFQGGIIRTLLNPRGWFDRFDRTETAIRFYNKRLFKDATFSDMNQPGKPLVVINATDLAYGVRFSFLQEYFDILCSDLSSFPVARAVAASSAVPVLFRPVVIANYSTCGSEMPDWLLRAEQKSQGRPELKQTVEGLYSYFDKSNRKFSHFVDGGITDNLGVRSIFDIVEMAGGTMSDIVQTEEAPKIRLVVISVDASINRESQMDVSRKHPSVRETIRSLSDTQLHRYNASTYELLNERLPIWADELSTDTVTVEPYMISIGFEQLESAEEIEFMNGIPTRLSLTNEQATKLIDAGQKLLRNNPEFIRLRSSLTKE